MPQLAAETLVAAHETTLERWKTTKSEQFYKLAPPVRLEPVYRPLAPSSAEEAFYRDRRRHIQSLTRFRVRTVSELRSGHIRAHGRVATIEDTDRMAQYRGRVSEVFRREVDWPKDVRSFARDEIPRHLPRFQRAAEAKDEDGDPASAKPSIIDLLPRSILANVAHSKRVNQHTLYRAVDDLQRRVTQRMPELTAEHSLLRYGPDHVVIIADPGLIATALAGYSDRTREAVARAHERSYPFDTPQSTTPLHVMTAPDELARISEVTTKTDASAHTPK